MKADLDPPNGFTEVNQTLTVKAYTHQGISETRYSFDFGDGSNIVRGVNTASHVYTQMGNYRLVVNASGGCNSTDASTTFMIRVPTPISKLSEINVIVNPAPSEKPVLIRLTLPEKSDANCTWYFGDGSVEKTFLASDRELAVNHTYVSAGNYKIMVACTNRLGNSTGFARLQVQEIIRGLRVVSIPTVKFGEAFKIEWSIEYGSDVMYSVLFNKMKQKAVISKDEKSGYVNINPEHYKTDGDFISEVTASNLVCTSEPVIKKVKILNAVVPFSLTVKSKESHVELNETIVLSMTDNNSKNRAFPTFFVDFGDGSPALTSLNTSLTHTFTKSGLFAINVTAINEVSQKSSGVLVSVLKPVILLSGLELFPSLSKTKENATINMTFDKGSDFNCNISFGDGQTKSLDYSRRFIYFENGNTAKAKFLRFYITVNHIYSSPNVYQITAVCSNRLSKVLKEKRIVIQDEIKGFSVEHVPPQIHGQTFELHWLITSGTNVSFEATIEETKLEVKFDGVQGWTQITKSFYSDPGLYLVEVVATNLVSLPQRYQQQIIIEKAIKEVNITYNSQETEPEMAEEVSFTVNMASGTNPLFEFNFGDASINTVTRLSSVVHVYGMHSNYQQGKPYVDYKISVQVRNNVSNVNASNSIRIYKPVVPLHEAKLSTKPTNVSTPSVFTIMMTQGSDFNCSIVFGDGRSEIHHFYHLNYLGEAMTPGTPYTNIKFQANHTYNATGEYQCQLTCSNRYNKLQNKTIAIVEEPITGLYVPQIEPVAFGETFQISWIITKGTGVNYRVTFGELEIEEVVSRQNGSCFMILPSQYHRPGQFRVGISLWNYVSKVHRINSVLIEKRISDVEMDVNYREIDVIRFGHGKEKKYFPAAIPLSFSANVTQGSNLRYNWSVLGNRMKTTFSEASFDIKLDSPGIYNVTVVVHNEVSRVSVFKEIVLQERVGLVTLEFRFNTPALVNRSVSFYIAIDNLGTDSCLVMNFTDGNTRLYGGPNCVISPPKGVDTGNVSYGNIEKQMEVTHSFYKSGMYKVVATLENEVSLYSISHEVEILQRNCRSPLVKLVNIGQSEHLPKIITRSDSSPIDSQVSVVCPESKRSRFKWSFSQHDARYNSYSAFKPEITSNNLYDPLSLPYLDLKQVGALPYGLLKISLRVELAESQLKGYFGEASGYIRVEPSRLEAKISGASLIRRGFGVNLVINASQSRDPDVERGNFKGKFIN